MQAYKSFCGSQGRTKNIGLFYLWLVWEENEPEFSDRALPVTIGRELGGISSSQPPSGGNSASGGRRSRSSTMEESVDAGLFFFFLNILTVAFIIPFYFQRTIWIPII